MDVQYLVYLIIKWTTKVEIMIKIEMLINNHFFWSFVLAYVMFPRRSELCAYCPGPEPYYNLVT